MAMSPTSHIHSTKGRRKAAFPFQEGIARGRALPLAGGGSALASEASALASEASEASAPRSAALLCQDGKSLASEATIFWPPRATFFASEANLANFGIV